MSITLDINKFLCNDRGADYTATNDCDDDPKHSAIGFPPNSASTLFDDFDQLLGNNKIYKIEPNENTNQSEEFAKASINDGGICESSSRIKTTRNVQQPNCSNDKKQEEKHKPKKKKKKQISDSILSAEFLQFPLSSNAETDFLLAPADESHSFHDVLHCSEDQQLFSVEDGDLKPIMSPFMVPGIYKKIPLSTGGEQVEFQKRTETKNVFISVIEVKGCIVSTSDFHDNFICLNDGQAVVHKEHLRNRYGEHLENIVENVDSPATSQVKVQPTRDKLDILAFDILKLSNHDNIIFDRERNEIIRNEESMNRRTIYRFLTPENLGLSNLHNGTAAVTMLDTTTYSNDIKPGPKTKRGRPRKQPKEPDKSAPQVKVEKTPEASATVVNNDSPKQIRTRFGRLVKNSFSQFVTQQTPQSEGFSVKPEEPDNESDFMNYDYQYDPRDREYKYTETTTVKKSVAPAFDLPATEPVKKRKFPSNSICPTCNKIFLGKRLHRHYQTHPDHMKVPAPDPVPPIISPSTASEVGELSLFKFLVRKLQNSQLTEDQRAELFLHEISDLVEQLQARSSRLIRNTSGLHNVNTRSAKILGIPEGHYSLDITAIEAPPDPPCILHFENIVPTPAATTTRSLDYNLSISLDDTITDTKLNLSGGNLVAPSEESLLRTVDDLMKEGMKKLGEGHADLLQSNHNQTASNAGGAGNNISAVPVINYDHASDNAVEAVSMKETRQPPILDLSLDLFQFNSN